MNFDEYINTMLKEAAYKPKIKTEKIFNNKPTGFKNKSVPLSYGIDKNMDNVLDKLKKGYYLLRNVSNYTAAIISPDDLSKLDAATVTELLKNKTVKIGRSSWTLMESYYDSISLPLQEFKVTGEQQLKVENSKQYNEGKAKAQILSGIRTGALTRSIADSLSDENGKVGVYVRDHKVVFIAQKGTIDTKKESLVFIVQQHSAQDYFVLNPQKLSWAEIPISELFPGSYKKSAWDKTEVYAVK